MLEALGIEVEIAPENIANRLAEDKMCFMFAPIYHQAMRYAAEARKEIGFRSIFNLLGPLTNPANTKYQLIGVFDEKYSLPMAETLRELGSEHVLLVHGDDGLDEISISSSTHVTELKNGQINQYTLTPEELGFSRYSLDDIRVASPKESAQLIVQVLEGNVKGAAYGIIALNAGAALYVGKKAPNLQAGVKLAQELLDSGRAYEHYLQIRADEGVLKHA